MSGQAAANPWSGGVFRRMFMSQTPAGLGMSVGIFLALLLVDQVLQAGFAMAISRTLLSGDMGNSSEMVRAALMSLVPVSIGVALVAWQFAKARGGHPPDVLSLHWPRLGNFGTAALICCFIIGLYVAVALFVSLAHIDLAQYTPGPHGESPDTGSAGLVKEAMFAIANSPAQFLLVLPGVAVGAPVAEELIFRGQIFTALSQTRLGTFGTIVVTAALWALMHMTEPWLAIGLIFVMGLVLGFLLYRFGSLLLCMLCHGAWNLVYSLLIFGTLQA